MRRVKTEIEIPSPPDADQAKWRGRKEGCDQAPYNVNTGDRDLIEVQHSPIQLHLTASSITASLGSERAKCLDAGQCTHTTCPPNTSALLPWRSLTELPLTTKMDAPPGTIPNLLHWLICFADLTTFEHNAEVSVYALEEGGASLFYVCIFVPNSDHSSHSLGMGKTPSWGTANSQRRIRNPASNLFFL